MKHLSFKRVLGLALIGGIVAFGLASCSGGGSSRGGGGPQLAITPAPPAAPAVTDSDPITADMIRIGTPTAGPAGANLVVGDEISGTGRLRNEGSSDVTPTVRFFWSEDTTLDSSDTQAANDQTLSISPNGEVSYIYAAIVPASPSSRIIYFCICIGSVCNYVAVRYESPPVTPPVTPPAAPASCTTILTRRAFPTGSSATGLAMRYTTGGVNGSIPAGELDVWSVTLNRNQAVIITTSSAFDTVGVLYNNTGRILVCNDDDGANGNFRIVHTPTYDGTHYIGVAEYADDAALDYRLTITPGRPDIDVIPSSVSNTSQIAGSSLSLSGGGVTNRGTAAAASVTANFYWSSNDRISTSDTFAGRQNFGTIAAGGQGTYSASVTVPSTAGTYYFGVCVPAVSGETILNNNCAALLQITVTNPPSYGAIAYTEILGCLSGGRGPNLAWGYASGRSTMEAARMAALSACSAAASRGTCEVRADFGSSYGSGFECFALAYGNAGRRCSVNADFGSSRSAAEVAALAKCRQEGLTSCWIPSSTSNQPVSACSN